ncbi:MAG: hypothetical protein FH751_07900 [Firmicutes bacterium]|nr:hypothetical protein [Bacillota bacterium]
MNIEVMAIESIGDMILIFLSVLLLPLGILIFVNIDYIANKWHERSKERSSFEYIYLFGFSIKSYTSVKWNKFVFRLIGSVGILIGSVSVIYLVICLVNM